MNYSLELRNTYKFELSSSFMKKRIIVLALVIFCLAAIISYAAVDVSKLKTEDLKLEKGKNVSLELNPGAPFSIRMYAGSTVDFDIDSKNYLLIFDNFGDVATIRYTTDSGKTFIQRKVKLGDSERVNTTSESWFFYLNYKIYNQRDEAAVVEVGKPLLQRYNVPIQVNNTEQNNLEDNKTVINEIKEDNTGNNYMKYLIGVIVVLVIIIIILGPKRKEIQRKVEDVKDAVSNKIGRKPKKAGLTKTYHKKPSKKKFDEEDVYVVKESEE